MFDFANAEQISDSEVNRSCLSNDEVLDITSGRATRERFAGLKAHVDRCDRCRQLVEDARQGSPSGRHPVHWDATFGEGDVVARRYRIQRFIARGGMGEVYDAFDRDLHERVALKTVLSTSNDSFRAVRRLRAEVQLAHRVSHPNVCRIYDLGAHLLPNGSPLNFLTMEFVDGESLRARVERGRLAPEESVVIARQLLLGLAAAHAAGILHRDFKSENVMLRSTKDAVPSVVIMDFGLASPMDPSGALFTSGANALVGTPCYMSPEQLEGAQLSAASDIYSFGVVWYEMLTGTLPFSLRTPFDRLRRNAPRPSRTCAEVPPALDALIEKCLARDRSARFSSADEVLDALDAMSARVSRITARSPRLARPFAVAAAAAFTISLLGWATLKPHGADRPRTKDPAARDQHRPSLPALPIPESAAQVSEGPHGDAPARAPVAEPPGVAPPSIVARPRAAPPASGVKRAHARVATSKRGAPSGDTSAVTPADPPPISAAGELESTSAVAAPKDAAAKARSGLEQRSGPGDEQPRGAKAPPAPSLESVPGASSRTETPARNEHGFLDPFPRRR
ncbi:MAG TPA: protein kinase [Polyangiaceae bacterium]|nr:protein kinase [Polyangiaceae bacterium]